MSSQGRLRDLGFPIGVFPSGARNGITDVHGVLVGHVTRKDGNRPGKDGLGPCNTGVTAILPHDGDLFLERVPAAIAVLNGSGEVYGREFVDEMGVLDGPIMMTSSYNVGRVADALISETARRNSDVRAGRRYVHPLVAECSDAYLSEITARPMAEPELLEAWSGASAGIVTEGSVGAGTGLVSFGFKGGIGTASRLINEGGGHTVGVLVSTNTGSFEQLRIGGISIGDELAVSRPADAQEGSIIMVVATDAPLLARQLGRLARRAFLGLARTGASARNGSGDISIAFSTANVYLLGEERHNLRDLDNEAISPLFDGVVEATEEAIVNALCAGEEMIGRGGNTAPALPVNQLLPLLRRAQRRVGGQ